ncbi:MAG: hypothetical protein NDI84_07475 [Steroidobacteraceae bacterium]|nr:hypothetical protein [Steroidobacteraceae bacterium]
MPLRSLRHSTVIHRSIIVPSPPASLVAVADLVVTGAVRDVNTLRADQERGLYTEYTIDVQSVEFQRGDSAVEPGVQLSVARMGGGFRQGGGEVVVLRYAEQGFLHQGGKYLLLLKTDSGANDILTAFAIANRRLHPVDSIVLAAPNLPLKAYDGMTVSEFMANAAAAEQGR